MILIDVDPDCGNFVSRTKTSVERRGAIDSLRTIDPVASFRVDAGALVLSKTTALALRARPMSRDFEWTDVAARYADTLGRNFADAPKARARVLRLQQPGEADRELGQYDLREKLDLHQRIAVAAMTDPVVHGICLFDEQGSGKTVMGIHAFDRLKKMNAASTLLIFAPKNMLGEWDKDFRRFTGTAYSVNVVSGSREDKYTRLIEASDVYVTNYETAQALEDTLTSLINRKLGRVVLIVDESFFVKNRDAKRSAAIRRLRNLCDRCWMLCGTPAPNAASDVIHQFDIADAGVTFDGVALPEDTSELRRVVKRTIENKGVYLRRLKVEILPNLPSKSFHRVQVPLAQAQARLYKDKLSSLVAEVEQTTEHEFNARAASFMARRTRLLQICSCPDQVDTTHIETPSKLLAMDEMLRKFIGGHLEKVIVWSFFRRSLDVIFKRYAQYNPVRIDGSVADPHARAQAVTQFQTDDTTMLFVANPAAAGAGLTLTRSHVAIYESFSPQAAHYLQSLDRIHRRGQQNEVDYYLLLSDGTIEEDEYERLLKKEQQAADLFGDLPSEVPRREVFLRELMEGLAKFSEQALVN
ncbi:MAG: DEAD/DEAH box helicase [Acidobacteria bacterium]|nr:DEAD/DEAH box helicase [Acidobacteriota bacterium]